MEAWFSSFQLLSGGNAPSRRNTTSEQRPCSAQEKVKLVATNDGHPGADEKAKRSKLTHGKNMIAPANAQKEKVERSIAESKKNKVRK